jgi:beta-1,4-mannosyl-glycoprotein beta-1,4-N-acetylglucosaminyltransferase
MFFNENDLYEIRLNQHWDFIDKFVVVEAGETHTGLKKPLNFDHSRFKPWASKIEYRSFNSFEEAMKQHPELIDQHTLMDRGPNKSSADWSRDHFQGNYMLKVLRDLQAKNDDIVFMSCCDEILRKQAFDACKDMLQKHPEGDELIFMFRLWLYAYKFNLLSKSCHESDPTAMLAKFSVFDKALPATLREFRICNRLIENAGWHFTYLDNSGGLQVLAKHRSWAHSKDIIDGEKVKFDYDEEHLADAVNHVIKGYNVKLVDLLPHTHPQYILDNLEKFKDYILESE